MTILDDATEPKPENETMEEIITPKSTWYEAIRSVMSNRNFRVFIVTAWIYSSMQVIGRYYTLYLRDIGISYFFVGTLLSAVTVVILVASFIAGYLADNYDRKRLSYITMGFNAAGFMILAFAYDIWTIALGLLTMAASNFTGKGGTAYIMEVIDRKHGGVAMSLFTLGTVLGLIPLFAVSVLLGTGWLFVDVMRALFLVAGIFYLACTIIRIIWLDSTPVPERTKSSSFLSDMLSENWRGIKLLAKIFPVFITVMIIDALSDNFYGFSNGFSFFYKRRFNQTKEYTCKVS